MRDDLTLTPRNLVEILNDLLIDSYVPHVRAAGMATTGTPFEPLLAAQPDSSVAEYGKREDNGHLPYNLEKCSAPLLEKG